MHDECGDQTAKTKACNELHGWVPDSFLVFWWGGQLLNILIYKLSTSPEHQAYSSVKHASAIHHGQNRGEVNKRRPKLSSTKMGGNL